jgi:ADP-heptose:LPS heptosyltransferase
VRWQQLIKTFPKPTFIQVGLPDEPLTTGAVDLRKNNSLRELIALLKYARCYVGMDTFWGHAAAAVNTPGVVLLGDGHPAVFGHDCHINLFKNFRCDRVCPDWT